MKLLRFLPNMLYFTFFLNFKIGSRSCSITFSCFSGGLVIVCKSLHLRFGFKKEADGRKGYLWVLQNCLHLNRIILPKGLPEPREGAFAECSDLFSAVLPASLHALSRALFVGDMVLKNVSFAEIGDHTPYVHFTQPVTWVILNLKWF